MISVATVDQWALMSNTSMVSIITFYFFFVFYIGPNIMRNRNAFDLKTIIRAYDAFQVIICFYIVIKLYFSAFTFERSWKCSDSFSDIKLIEIREIQEIWWYGVVVRAIELLETVFFILRKKSNQVTLLHVYHHVMTLLNGWYFLKYDQRKYL